MNTFTCCNLRLIILIVKKTYLNYFGLLNVAPGSALNELKKVQKLFSMNCRTRFQPNLPEIGKEHQ